MILFYVHSQSLIVLVDIMQYIPPTDRKSLCTHVKHISLLDAHHALAMWIWGHCALL